MEDTSITSESLPSCCFICLGTEKDDDACDDYGPLLDLSCTRTNHHFAHKICFSKWLQATAGGNSKWICPYCQLPLNKEFIRQNFLEFEFKLVLQTLCARLANVTVEDVENVGSMFLMLKDGITVADCLNLVRVMQNFILRRGHLKDEMFFHVLQKCLLVEEILNEDYATEGVMLLSENLRWICESIFTQHQHLYKEMLSPLKLCLFRCFSQLLTEGTYDGKKDARYFKLGRRILATYSFGELQPLIGSKTGQHFARVAFREGDFHGALLLCVREVGLEDTEPESERAVFWTEMVQHIKTITPTSIHWSFVKSLSSILHFLVFKGRISPTDAIDKMDEFRLACKPPTLGFQETRIVQKSLWYFASCFLTAGASGDSFGKFFSSSSTLKPKQRILSWIADSLLPENLDPNIVFESILASMLPSLLFAHRPHTFKDIVNNMTSRLARDLHAFYFYDDEDDLAENFYIYRKCLPFLFFIVASTQMQYCKCGCEHVDRRILNDIVLTSRPETTDLKEAAWMFARHVFKYARQQLIDRDVVLSELNKHAPKLFKPILCYANCILSLDDSDILIPIIQEWLRRESDAGQENWPVLLQTLADDCLLPTRTKCKSALEVAMLNIVHGHVLAMLQDGALEEEECRKQHLHLISSLVQAGAFSSWMLDILFKILEKGIHFSFGCIENICTDLIKRKHISRAEVDRLIGLLESFPAEYSRGYSAASPQYCPYGLRCAIDSITAAWEEHRTWSSLAKTILPCWFGARKKKNDRRSKKLKYIQNRQ